MSIAGGSRILYILQKSSFHQDLEEPFSPPMDIYLSGDCLHLEIELPALNPQHIQLSIKGDVLTIEGVKEREPTYSDAISFIRAERFIGPFRRSVKLPFYTDKHHVEATYKKGILYIKINMQED